MNKEANGRAPVERTVMFIRTLTAFILRLALRVPLVFLAHLMWSFANFFEQLGDGFNDAQVKLKQITSAPFVVGWRSQIADLEESERLRTLKILRGELDT